MSEVIQVEPQIRSRFTRKFSRNLLFEIFNKNNTTSKNLFTLQGIEDVALHVEASANDGRVVALCVFGPLQGRLKQREAGADIELRFLVGAAVGEDGLRPGGAAARSRWRVENFVEFLMRVDTVGPEAVKVYGPVDVVDALEVVLDGGEKVLLGLGEFEVGGEIARLDSGDGDEGEETSADGVEDFVEGCLGLTLGGVLVGLLVNGGAPDGVDTTGSSGGEGSRNS